MVAVVVVIVDVDDEEGEGGGEDAQRRMLWGQVRKTRNPQCRGCSSRCNR